MMVFIILFIFSGMTNQILLKGDLIYLGDFSSSFFWQGLHITLPGLQPSQFKNVGLYLFSDIWLFGTNYNYDQSNLKKKLHF